MTIPQLKALIIDDEKKARTVLESFLQTFCPEVGSVYLAASVQEGLSYILREQPDVVFLDIEMPGENGFVLLDYFEELPFALVFTTAYEDYAIQAFRAAAVDYLLKPINIAELQGAVHRVVKMRSTQGEKKQRQQQMEALKANVQPDKHIKRLVISSADEILVLNKDDIIYLKAERAYTQLITKDRRITTTRPLRYFAEILAGDHHFFRTHRSFLINLKKVVRYLKVDSQIEMVNLERIALTTNRKEAFLTLLRAL